MIDSVGPGLKHIRLPRGVCGCAMMTKRRYMLLRHPLFVNKRKHP